MSQHVTTSRSSDKLLVGAIDFGTTFSGWSFLFGHQYGSDPTKVFAKNWNNGTNISSKTPTTILIAPDGKTMEKFGYEAEDRYATLAGQNNHRKYFYFRRFKMKLYEKMVLNRDMNIEDENGKQLPAMTVFSLSIQYIHDNLLKVMVMHPTTKHECQRQIADGGVDKEDIHWVITVPAIWNDAAKQFMREAAVKRIMENQINIMEKSWKYHGILLKKAGIKTTKLTIALEPEAASIFCKYLAIERYASAQGLSIDTFSPGSKYIVLDAGGMITCDL